MSIGHFIGQVNINGDTHAIGSTLFGICKTGASTAEKIVELTGFNTLSDGVTVHVYFTAANTVTSNVKLKIGNTLSYFISNPNGSLLWAAGSIISFTFLPEDEDLGTSPTWVMNSSQIDASQITIDVTQLSNLKLGNISNQGTLIDEQNTAHPNAILITDNNAKIIAGAVLGSTANGTFLDNTGAWAAPPDTKYKLVVAATNSAIANGAGTNNSTYLNLVEDSTVLNSHKLTGTNITITSTSNGEIQFEGKPGTVTSVRVQATDPVVSSQDTAQNSTLNTTISLKDYYGDIKNPYGVKTAHYILAGPESGSDAAPTFRALVDGDIPNTIARLASPTFTGTPLLTTTPATGDNSHAIADTAFVIAEINSRLAANDAMLFKGTIGAVTGATINSLPTNSYQAGDTYRVVGANGYSFGSGSNAVVCEEGDLIIAIKDGPATGTSIIPGDWTVAQTNIDGALYMGSTYTPGSGQLLVAGSSGAVNTSGFTIASPTAGGILYGTTNGYNILSAGTNNYVLTMSNGSPVWAQAQHYLTHLYVNGTAAGATSNAAVTTGNTYIHLYDDSTKRETIQLIGSGGTTITATDAGAITIKSKKYKSASLAYALNALTLSYNDGSAQSETPSASTPVAVVSGGTLYIKSIAYGTAQFSTDVAEDITT